MNDAAVMAHQKDALTGHRPTWKMGTGKRNARPDLRGLGATGDPFSLFGTACVPNSRRTRRPPGRSATPNARRLTGSGSTSSATPRPVKMRFKELVKRLHPDANGGDRSTENSLVEKVIQSYNYLKSAGFG